ncbi:hypothetical protein LCGC14_0698660 [marine sediment metagenome]|uniref:Uncharacterized protein n=1 Tax=marine sediment metagenome TaxID=412755 RepID=A0A0F9R3W8_9ZZZZ
MEIPEEQYSCPECGSGDVGASVLMNLNDPSLFDYGKASPAWCHGCDAEFLVGDCDMVERVLAFDARRAP